MPPDDGYIFPAIISRLSQSSCIVTLSPSPNRPKNQMKEKFVPALDFPFLTKSFDLFLTLAMPEKKIKGDLIGLMGIKGGEAILDFGCGTGNLLILGKEKYPEARFEGLDIDPKVLAIARRKIAGRKLNISLTEYDGGTLPQADKLSIR